MSIRPLFIQHDRSLDSRRGLPTTTVSEHSNRPGAKVAAVPQERGFTLWLMWVVLLAVAFATLLVSQVSAQQANFPYDSIPMHPKLLDEAVVKSVEAQAKSFATTGAGDPRIANGYFTAYVPAKMTAPDGIKYISDIAKETNSMLARAQRSNKPQVAQQLTKFVFDGMKKVAEGNYHPAARINATLILSRLDRQVANPSTRTPPIPMRETLPILIALYEDQNNVDGVRAAALHGLHRQVSYGFPQISPDDRTKISTLMTGLLESPAPKGRPTDAHAYLQRYAVDILDVLRAKEDKSLGTKLISISTEPTNPDLIALYSASRLAAMGPELQGQVQTPKIVLDSWSKRVLKAFESELARLDGLDKTPADRTQPAKPETLLEKKTTETAAARPMGPGAMDSMMDMEMGYDMSAMMPDYEDMGMGVDMMSMYGMGMPGAAVVENPQPAEVIASRQKLNDVLQHIHLGVTGQPVAGIPTRTPGGILASVPENQKKVVEDWVTEMEAVVTALNDKTLDDRKKYREGLVAQIEVLKGIAGVEDAEPAANPAAAPDQFAPVDPLAQFAPANEPAPAPAAAPPAAPPANNVLNDLVSP